MTTPPPWTPSPEAATRRQLRFSLFLQAFALLMLSGALVVRVAALGWDFVAGLLTIGVVVVVAAIGYTFRRLRTG